jgi:hypothetical protein
MNSSRIKTIQEKYPDIPLPIIVKTELLFHGVRYTPELGEAGEWAIPNYQPYRFQQGEENPTGKDSVPIPYLMTLEKECLVRVLGNGNSPYRITGGKAGYVVADGDEKIMDVAFQRKPEWQLKTTSDGIPMSAAGVSQHGDMLIVNPTPGCEYFMQQDEQTGKNYRCVFCHYGSPGKRSRQLGQKIGEGEIDPGALKRIMEVCEEALPGIRHVYLVGGSMIKNEEEARRYIQLAEAIRKINKDHIPVCCGSSSLKLEALMRLKSAGVTGVCFNLEVWDENLWGTVCPGKEQFIGRERWIQGLLDGVKIFGRGNVMSAFVAAIEFTIDRGNEKIEHALDSCLTGTEWLLQRGIVPLYSIHWPVNMIVPEADPIVFVQDYFLRLNAGQYALRNKYKLTFANELVCHHCTYMQLECDFDYYLDT